MFSRLTYLDYSWQCQLKNDSQYKLSTSHIMLTNMLRFVNAMIHYKSFGLCWYRLDMSHQQYQRYHHPTHKARWFQMIYAEDCDVVMPLVGRLVVQPNQLNVHLYSHHAPPRIPLFHNFNFQSNLINKYLHIIFFTFL